MVITCDVSNDQNLISIILGKESEDMLSLDGSISTPASEVLEGVNPDNPIYVRVSHCTVPEATALLNAKSYGLKAGMVVRKINQLPRALRAKAIKLFSREDGGSEEVVREEPPAPVSNKGMCQYCGFEKELLDVPGFKVCKTCAQIELGRRLEKKGGGAV